MNENSNWREKLKHLYISPISRCNLSCKMCYTEKTNQMLSEKQILDFITSYKKVERIESIAFCGGEVFLLPYFPSLVNSLNEIGILVQIITNGTINNLKEFKYPNQVNLIVSLDGLNNYHDVNRGNGNFHKSISFLKDARTLGFHTHIFSIVTRSNVEDIEKFEALLEKTLGYKIGITYHPRKPLQYLLSHPKDNKIGTVNGFDFINESEEKELRKKRDVFPPQNFGCYQISLMADGKVYGCCEGTKAIGKINDPVLDLINVLKKGIKNDCAYPDFKCGIQNSIIKPIVIAMSSQ